MESNTNTNAATSTNSNPMSNAHTGTSRQDEPTPSTSRSVMMYSSFGMKRKANDLPVKTAKKTKNDIDPIQVIKDYNLPGNYVKVQPGYDDANRFNLKPRLEGFRFICVPASSWPYYVDFFIKRQKTGHVDLEDKEYGIIKCHLWLNDKISKQMTNKNGNSLVPINDYKGATKLQRFTGPRYSDHTGKEVDYINNPDADIVKGFSMEKYNMLNKKSEPMIVENNLTSTNTSYEMSSTNIKEAGHALVFASGDCSSNNSQDFDFDEGHTELDTDETEGDSMILDNSLAISTKNTILKCEPAANLLDAINHIKNMKDIKTVYIVDEQEGILHAEFNKKVRVFKNDTQDNYTIKTYEDKKLLQRSTLDSGFTKIIEELNITQEEQDALPFLGWIYAMTGETSCLKTDDIFFAFTVRDLKNLKIIPNDNSGRNIKQIKIRGKENVYVSYSAIRDLYKKTTVPNIPGSVIYNPIQTLNVKDDIAVLVRKGHMVEVLTMAWILFDTFSDPAFSTRFSVVERKLHEWFDVAKNARTGRSVGPLACPPARALTSHLCLSSHLPSPTSHPSQYLLVAFL